MRTAPPREYWDNLPIPELITAVTDGMTVIIRKTFFHYALERVSDRLDNYDLERLKEQLNKANGLMALMIRKRIDYNIWLTGAVSDGGTTETKTSDDYVGHSEERKNDVRSFSTRQEVGYKP